MYIKPLIKQYYSSVMAVAWENEVPLYEVNYLIYYTKLNLF